MTNWETQAVVNEAARASLRKITGLCPLERRGPGNHALMCHVISWRVPELI